MRKRTIFALACLSLVLVSVLSLPQGFAKITSVRPSSHNSTQYTDWTVGAVSSSTAGCTNLGLKGFYGDVLVTSGKLIIVLEFVNPSSTYSVSVAQVSQVKGDGACDGTWNSLGTINTGQGGVGGLTQKDKLASGWYVFEFKDSAGTLAYATSTVSL